VDELALVNHIKSKKVLGAALDVFENEPLSSDHPLLSCPEVILTPHLGASTKDAIKNVSVAIANQIKDYLLNAEIRNALNAPALDAKDAGLLRPYMVLAETLGSFVSQLADGAISKLEVSVMGDLAAIDYSPITQAVVKGVLERYVDKSVNYVNALILANERGIEVSSGSSPVKRNFSALLGVRIETEKESRFVEGTIFDGEQSRLVTLDDYLLEAKVNGDMLVITNVDQPGVIGKIGMTLGSKNINIAAFQLGRIADRPNSAMSIVNIDSTPTKDDIDKLTQIEAVTTVKLVRI
ncbi:MAG: NAD(P)-dependent oxidoreductase, partial [Nitrospinota bacterium]